MNRVQAHAASDAKTVHGVLSRCGCCTRRSHWHSRGGSVPAVLREPSRSTVSVRREPAGSALAGRLQLPAEWTAAPPQDSAASGASGDYADGGGAEHADHPPYVYVFSGVQSAARGMLDE